MISTEVTGEAVKQRKPILQSLFIVVAAGMFAGVLYVGDTTMEDVSAALPNLPLALPILVVVAVLTFFGTPDAQRRSWLNAMKGAGNVKQWPMAVWALVAFYAWLFWMILSGLWAPEAAEVAPVVTALVTLGFIAAVSAILFYLHPQALGWLWLAVAICSLIFLYGGITGPEYVGRMTAFGGGPNVFARFMLFGIGAAIFFTLLRNYLWAVLLLIAPFAYGLVASGSRGVLVASSVLVIFFAVAVFFRWGWKWVLVFYAAAAAIAISGYAKFIAGTAIEEYFKTRFINLTFEKKHDSGRSLLHDEAFRIMSEHRVVGGGLHSFVVLSNSKTATPLEHPHNIFYTVGSEAGVVGIVLLAITLVTLAFSCRHLFRFLPAGLTAAVAFTILVAQLASGYYYDSRPVWLFGFAAAFAMLSLCRRAESAVVDSPDEPTPDTALEMESNEAEPAAEIEPIAESAVGSEVEEEVQPVPSPEPAPAAEVTVEPTVEPEPAAESEPVPVAVTDTAEPFAPELGPAVAVVKQSAPDNKHDNTKLRVAVAAIAAAGAAGAIGWLVRSRSNAEVDARAEKLLREMFNEK